MNNADQPAFPVEDIEVNHKGLTKRELIAAVTLQGILANPQHNTNELMGVNGSRGNIGFIECLQASKEAIRYADTLLQQLEITKPKP